MYFVRITLPMGLLAWGDSMHNAPARNTVLRVKSGATEHNEIPDDAGAGSTDRGR